jgi:hypothetical protein
LPNHGTTTKTGSDFREAIMMTEEIAPAEVSAEKHPRVHDWWTKLQARPANARANFCRFIDS